MKNRDPYHILVVCTGNICRSAMGEVILREELEKIAPGRFVVRSAGTHVYFHGAPAERSAVQAVRELGLDLSAHRTRQMDASLADWADLILGMEDWHCRQIERSFPAARGKTFSFGGYARGRAGGADVDDPYGGSMRVFRACAQEIAAHAQRLAARLAGQARKKNRPT